MPDECHVHTQSGQSQTAATLAPVYGYMDTTDIAYSLAAMLIFVASCIVGGILQRRVDRKRDLKLRELGVVVNFESIDRNKIARVIAIDVGFGEEIWLFESEDNEDISFAPTSRLPERAVVWDRNCELPSDLQERVEKLSIRF